MAVRRVRQQVHTGGKAVLYGNACKSFIWSHNPRLHNMRHNAAYQIDRRCKQQHEMQGILNCDWRKSFLALRALSCE